MSGLFFPTLIGQGWSVIKTPIWKTKVQEAISGRELRAAYQSQPRWKWSLTFNLLRDSQSLAELQNLIGFFNTMQGQFDSFYYIDPTEYQVTNQNIGTGNGSNKTFILTRTIGIWTGPVLVNGGAPDAVKVAGTPTSAYTVTYGVNTSSIVLTSAPTAGQSVTWTGSYAYRCRFLSDSTDFENFLSGRWQNKKLEFISLR